MKKRIIFKVTGIVFGSLLLVLAIFLGCTAMTFSFGGKSSAPDIFGYNIYLVRDNDFYQLKAGTAALAESTFADEVKPGEIIIYKRYENSGVQLGRVNSSVLKEAVVSMDIETEEGDNITISQGQFVARVTHYSDFLGAIIDFAMSPFGVMTIAVLPCLAIVAFEIVKFVFRKLPTPEVETIKIQEETPTFIPRKQRELTEKQRKENSRSNERSELFGENSPKTTLPAAGGNFGQTKRNTLAQAAQPENAIKAENVKDRIDFSPAAREEMAQSRAAAEKAEGKSVKATPTVLPPKNTEKKPSPKKEASSEPDISMVFSDDNDKGYNIDDILADIEKRKK